MQNYQLSYLVVLYIFGLLSYWTNVRSTFFQILPSEIKEKIVQNISFLINKFYLVSAEKGSQICSGKICVVQKYGRMKIPRSKWYRTPNIYYHSSQNESTKNEARLKLAFTSASGPFLDGQRAINNSHWFWVCGSSTVNDPKCIWTCDALINEACVSPNGVKLFEFFRIGHFWIDFGLHLGNWTER